MNFLHVLINIHLRMARQQRFGPAQNVAQIIRFHVGVLHGVRLVAFIKEKPVFVRRIAVQNIIYDAVFPADAGKQAAQKGFEFVAPSGFGSERGTNNDHD